VTINVDTGAGFVDGHLLINDTDVDIFVNLCGTPGQTRQNRVVMVENNTNVLYSPGNLLFPAAYAAGIPRNSARLAILQGSCGTPGGLPALVQNANYWYTELARFQVSSAAVGAITDYRDYCEFSSEVAVDSVDDTQVSNRVPQLYRRQGGHADDWEVPGAVNRTPGMVRIQCGAIEVTLTGSGAGELAVTVVTYPVAFSHNPLIFVSLGSMQESVVAYGVPTIANETTQANISLRSIVNNSNTFRVNWMAIGTE